MARRSAIVVLLSLSYCAVAVKPAAAPKLPAARIEPSDDDDVHAAATPHHQLVDAPPSDDELGLAAEGDADGDGAARELEPRAGGKWMMILMGVVRMVLSLLPVLLRRAPAVGADGEEGGGGELPPTFLSLLLGGGQLGGLGGIGGVMGAIGRGVGRFRAWATSPQAAPVMLSLLVVAMKLVKRAEQRGERAVEEAAAEDGLDELQESESEAEDGLDELQESESAGEGAPPSAEGVMAEPDDVDEPVED